MRTRLHHVLTGASHAPIVTLAHGLATDLTMWDAIVPALEERYRVLRYDARGHGKSPAPSDAFTLTELGQDVIDLLDELEIDETHFVGLSMGGMVGMGLGLDHPQRIRKLVVCDARGDAPEAYRDSWTKRIETVQQEGIYALAVTTVQRWFTPEFMKDAAAVERMCAMVAATTQDGYIGCARALRELDYARRLPQMSVPTLFMVGSQDAGAPPETMRHMHTNTPGSKFVEIENAGHMSAVEQPERVASSIISFLGAGT